MNFFITTTKEKMKFTLLMEDLVLDDENIDEVFLVWKGDHTLDELTKMMYQWYTSRNFLTSRIINLTRVGGSILTMEIRKHKIGGCDGYLW